tara:strand:- start:40 stop:168 length:129 start_codon:yes stop_codon:yes gene_type:complete
MIKVLLFIFVILSGCGKKGELYLDSKDSNQIIQIDQERIYKF